MYVEISINYLAVLVGAIVYMVIGFVWYSPFAFGDKWMKLVRLNKQKLQEMQERGMGKAYVLSFLSALLLSYILAHFVDFTGAKLLSSGMQTGFWLWLGFVATTTLPNVLYARKPFKLYLLDNGYQLASFIVMGAILAVWV